MNLEAYDVESLRQIVRDLDYITGVMCAVAKKKLLSAVGFKGICRKVLIFALVGMAAVRNTSGRMF